MKQRWYIALLAAEAVLCLCLYSGAVRGVGMLPAVMAFPFAQIGAGLRSLSLSGPAGNAAAIVLYLLTGLIPAFVFLWLMRTGRKRVEDGMLLLLCLLLLFTLYLMINPGLMAGWFQNPVFAAEGLGSALLGCTFYSVLVCYLVLRILHSCRTVSTEKLQKGLVWLLYLLPVVFVYCIFGSSFGSLLSGLRELRAGSTAASGNLMWDIGQMGHQERTASAVFLVIRYAAAVLPYGMDIGVALAGIRLLKEMQADRYSEAAGRAAERLSQLSRTALSVTVISVAGVNLLQLLFIRKLYSVDSSVEIPLFSIIFTLAAFLLARFFREDQKLKADHDLFI